MKNLILVSAIVALIGLNACAQSDKNLPANVKAGFDQKFPTAQKIKWSMENSSEWEAEFKLNGKEYSANYSAEGKWLETEYEISESEIPSAVAQTLAKEFPGFKKLESEISETVAGKVYEFEIKDGKQTMEVAVNPEGTLLKKESIKENEDEND